MASDKIKSTDVFEGDIFKGVKAGAESLTEPLKGVADGLKAILEQQRAILETSKIDSAQNIKKINEALKDSQTAQRGLVTVKKELERLKLAEAKTDAQKIKNQGLEIENTKKVAKADQESIKASQQKIKVKQDEAVLRGKEIENTNKLIRQKEVESRAEKAQIQTKEAANRASERATKQAARETAQRAKLNSAYARESTRLLNITARLKDLIVQGKTTSKTFRLLQSEADKLGAKLKSADAAAGQFQRNVGNYPRILKGAIGGLKRFGLALGITGGVLALANALRGAAKTIALFEQRQTTLASILDKTREQTINLTKDAEKYGATTFFTASQVSELQIELAKLGFTLEQISGATEGALALAAAFGTDLARAAKVTAGTIRGFNLAAEESGRVADVIASAYSNSAIDLEKFEVAISKVAPIAQSLNIDLETTTAVLGQLINANFDASTAGTQFRNILLKMSDGTSDLAKEVGFTVKSSEDLIEAFDILNEKGLEVADTQKLIDVRSVALLQNLIDNTEAVKDLAVEFDNAGGIAERIANKQLETLSGKTTLIKSAWDAWILSIDNGNGVIATATKRLLDFGTALLKAAGGIPAVDPSRAFFDAAGSAQTLADSGDELLNKFFELEEGFLNNGANAKEMQGVLIQLKNTLGDAAVSFNEVTEEFELQEDAAKRLIGIQRKLEESGKASLAQRLKAVQDDIASDKIKQSSLEKVVAVNKELADEQERLIRLNNEAGFSDEIIQGLVDENEDVKNLTKSTSELSEVKSELTDLEFERKKILSEFEILGVDSIELNKLLAGSIEEVIEEEKSLIGEIEKLEGKLKTLVSTRDNEILQSQELVDENGNIIVGIKDIQKEYFNENRSINKKIKALGELIAFLKGQEKGNKGATKSVKDLTSAYERYIRLIRENDDADLVRGIDDITDANERLKDSILTSTSLGEAVDLDDLTAVADNIDRLSELRIKAVESEAQVEIGIIQDRIDAITALGDKATEEDGLKQSIAIEERKKLERELADDITDIKKDANDEQQEFLDDFNNAQVDALKDVEEEEKESLKRRFANYAGFLADVAKALERRVKEQNDVESKQLDEEVDRREKSADRQFELAKDGVDNTFAYQQNKAAEARTQQLNAEEQARKQEEALRLASIYFSALESRFAEAAQNAKKDDGGTGVNNNNAPFFALKDTFLAEAVSSSIAGAFATGVENFQGKGSGTSDSNLIAFSHGESVVTAKGTTENAGLVSAMNAGNVDDYFARVWMPKFDMDNSTRNITKTVKKDNTNYKLLNEIKALRAEAAGRPVQQVHVDSFGNIIEESYRNGLKTTISHQMKKPL